MIGAAGMSPPDLALEACQQAHEPKKLALLQATGPYATTLTPEPVSLRSDLFLTS